MARLKQLGIIVVGLLLLFIFTLLIWSLLPVTPDREGFDPSVVYTNKMNPQGPQFKGAFFEYSDHTLHYVEAGEGEVVLFLHGFPSYWYSLIRPMQALKNNYRVVAIDGLGKGRSDVPKGLEPYKLESMTAHLYALINHLEADKVHLVGHDWGAGIAFAMAQRYPERVSSVTGMSAPPGPVLLELLLKSEKHRQTFDYINTFRKANPPLLLMMNVGQQIWEGSYKPLLDEGLITEEEASLFVNAASDPKRINAHISWYRANIPKFDEISDESFWPSRNTRVTSPAMFIWGEDDFLISPEVIAELHKLTGNELELLSLKGVKHRPQFEADEAVIDALHAFLAKHK